MFLISDVYPLTCPSEVVYVPYATINDTVIIRYNNTGVTTPSSTIHIQYHPPAGSLISINDHVNVMATAYDATGNSTSCNFTYEATSKFFFMYFKIYCESTFIRWHQFSWFLQNTFIREFLITWFQTLQATINGKICIWLDFNFHGFSEQQNPRKLEPHD